MSNTASKLRRGSILRVTTIFVRVSIAFYMMPFLIHSLGDRYYGMWALVMSITGYYFLLDFGLPTAINRYVAYEQVAPDKTRANVVLVTSLALLSAVALISFCLTLAIFFAVPIFLHNPQEILIFKKVIIIIGIHLSINFLFSPFSGILSANLRYDLKSLLQITTSIISTLTIIYFITKGYKLIALATIVLFFSVARNCTTLYITRKTFKWIHIHPQYFRPDYIPKLVSYSVYTLIIKISNQIRNNLDNFVIALFLTLSVVAHFNIALRFIAFHKTFILASIGLFIPVFTRYHAKNDYTTLTSRFIFTTKVAVIISTTLGGAIIIYSKHFIHRWMGEAYLDAYHPLLILIIPSILALAQLPSSDLLYAVVKHRFLAFLNLAEGGVNLLLSLILIQHYGIVGVAIGTAIPLFITRILIQPKYVCRQIKYSVKAYYRHLFSCLFVMCVSQIPLYAFVHIFGRPTYSFIVMSAFVFYPVYLLSVYKYFLSSSEKELLLGRFGHKIPFITKSIPS